MAKAAISGGGGGSHGADVNILDELVATEKARRSPPAGSFTVAQYAARAGLSVRAARDGIKRVQNLESGIFIDGNCRTRFFWRATGNKSKPKR